LKVITKPGEVIAWGVGTGSLEEEGLAERAVGLVARVEPLADAGHMELVLAVPTLHRRNRFVNGMQHAVTDEALFHAVQFLVDVALPEKDRRDDVTVARLQQIPD